VNAQYVLGLGDDSLISSHRLAEWSGRAPGLEEDVALANIALDQLGQARLLLQYAGSQLGQTEDDLAYLRGEREFRNVQLAELPNGDFGHTIARLLCFSSYQVELYSGLASGPDPALAAIAGKAVKEVRYHRDYASQWTRRLGDGTAESHRRMAAGLDAVWPYTYELFEDRHAGPVPGPARAGWLSSVTGVLTSATLEVPADDDGWRPAGGRDGLHTEALGFLLAEMQYLHRAYPGATW
jgi:ring-1,2-phenylacetyl-CoA epoxidase subunit PaaC